MPAGPTDKAKKILILTMSAGAGHLSAAKAINKELWAQNPSWEITVADHAELIGKLKGQVMTKSYNLMTSYFPGLWKAFYDLADFNFPRPLFNQLRHLFSRVGERRVVNFVLKHEFDYIICTHFASAHIISAMKKANQLTLPLAVVITDFGLNQIWLANKVDHYFVASDYTKQQLIAAGVNIKIIHAFGIPIRQEFAQRAAKLERAAAKKTGPLKLLIVETRTNRKPLFSLLRALLAQQSALQITLVGLKPQHLEPVQKLLHQLGFKAAVHGFINNLEDYLATADLVITKAGGLTTAEAMALQTPMIALRPIPGQEMTNVKALLAAGAGLHAKNEKQAAKLVAQLIKDPAQLARMQAATQTLARPQAASDIAKLIKQKMLS